MYVPYMQVYRSGLGTMLRQIKGVVFDMDGTLCLPQTPMFKEMRDALGITKATDILDYVHSLPEEEQELAQEKLRTIARKYMVHMIPQPGLNELMDYIVFKQLKMTILTRNFLIPVEHLRSNFLKDYPMSPIITREFRPPKPAPDGILLIAETWGVDPRELIMIGDSIDDMQAGRSAGALTVLLENDVNKDVADLDVTDMTIKTLPDLIPILDARVP